MALLTNRKTLAFQRSEIDRLESNLFKLANGDFNLDMEVTDGDSSLRDEVQHFNHLNQSLQKIKEMFENIASETEGLPSNVRDTNLSYRLDETRYPGNFKKIVGGINATLNTVDEKTDWYEAIIDAVPFPIHVTDNDMNWTYMNKAFEKLMIDQGAVKDKRSGYGKPCCNAGANICNTDKCGIQQLKRGVPVSYFDWCGMSCKQDTAFLKNRKGESIGFVEVVTDLTSILREHDYTKAEVDRLASNLGLLASGDLNLDLQVKEADKYSEDARKNFVKINSTLKKAKDALRELIDDAEMLSQAAIDGKLNTRADVTKHAGDYRKIVEGVNATLDTVVSKNNWYEAIIDAVPFPIHVTDNDMNWTFMNKAFEKLMIDQGAVKDRKSGYGKPCCNAGANICNTDKCGIRQLKKGVPVSYFDWCGMNCKQDTAYLKNSEGEPVGFVEVVTDLTSILRVSDYTKAEVERLATNLNLLASGDLNLDLQVGEADKYTLETKENFEKINSNLKKAKNAIGELINDALFLSEEAIEGKLSVRVDPSKHVGDYRKIVEGVNSTLDAVIAPVQEAASVLDEMAKGNLKVTMNGNYRGEHAKIKQALNGTLGTLASYVNEISHVLTEMANKNMVVSITRDYLGDFAEIKDSLNNIILSLNEVLIEISSSADQVAAGSSQVANGAQALAQGATEQASSVEELTASLDSLSGQTAKNASDADRASKLALNAKDDAEKGNDQMQDLLRAMEEINAASTNISKIIKVIEDIAFQTNILSLNAAVEAARAGSYGKGFAVVANEVRNLAAKSANAAKETTNLIEGSIKKAEVGTKIAGETAKALNKIVNAISDASSIVDEIAQASNAQSEGISQINTGLSQVAQVTQENSATSEESAAASEELSSQASMLKEMIGHFKLKNEEARPLDINPDMLNTLKGMIEKKNYSFSSKQASPKAKISLSGDFGKY